MMRDQVKVTQHSENKVVLFDLSSNSLVEMAKKVVVKPGHIFCRLPTQQPLFRILSLIHWLKMIAFAIVVVAIKRYQVNIHHRKPRHDKTAKRSDVNWRVNCVQYGNNKI